MSVLTAIPPAETPKDGDVVRITTKRLNIVLHPAQKPRLCLTNQNWLLCCPKPGEQPNRPQPIVKGHNNNAMFGQHFTRHLTRTTAEAATVHIEHDRLLFALTSGDQIFRVRQSSLATGGLSPAVLCTQRGPKVWVCSTPLRFAGRGGCQRKLPNRRLGIGNTEELRHIVGNEPLNPSFGGFYLGLGVCAYADHCAKK